MWPNVVPVEAAPWTMCWECKACFGGAVGRLGTVWLIHLVLMLIAMSTLSLVWLCLLGYFFVRPTARWWENCAWGLSYQWAEENMSARCYIVAVKARTIVSGPGEQVLRLGRSFTGPKHGGLLYVGVSFQVFPEPLVQLYCARVRGIRPAGRESQTDASYSQ
jgi:hypothetical protein